MARSKNYDIPEQKFIQAIEHLESGGTKKRACEILGVTNNKTMERLIDEYLTRKQTDREMRRKIRRQPILTKDVVSWITDYLQGDTFEELSDRYYRSAAIIKDRIEAAGALLRVNEKIDPLNPPMLPEQCVADDFEIGQIVWSSKYGCAVEVRGKYKDAYRILVATPGKQESAYQPSYELGSLKHLEEMGVNIGILVKYYDKDCMAAVNKTIIEMNKKAKK